MDTNFSVIHQNPKADKELPNFDGNNLGELSLPSLSQRSGLNIRQNFDYIDYDEMQSPIAGDFNFEDFDKKVESSKQKSVIEIKKERLEKSKDRSQRKKEESTQVVQEGDEDLLKPAVKQSKMRRQSNVSADQSGTMMKTLGKYARSKVVNTETASQQNTKKEQLVPEKTQKLEEHDDDISQILKIFEVNYNQQLSLDDKRARMFIVNLMQTAKVQGQVKDDSFFMIVEKNSLEKIDDLRGRCLSFRKNVWKFKTHTVNLAAFIINSKLFDSISLLIIILNSIQLALDDPTSGQTPLV